LQQLKIFSVTGANAYVGSYLLKQHVMEKLESTNTQCSLLQI